MHLLVVVIETIMLTEILTLIETDKIFKVRVINLNALSAQPDITLEDARHLVKHAIIVDIRIISENAVRILHAAAQLNQLSNKLISIQ